jgi:hypothetical protein
MFFLNLFSVIDIEDFEVGVDYCDYKVDKNLLSHLNTSQRIAM